MNHVLRLCRGRAAAAALVALAATGALTACGMRGSQCELNSNCATGAGGPGGASSSSGAGASGPSSGGGGACPTGFADCNGKASDGCEVDVVNNGDHCGACGHSCELGGCQAGACVPYAIVSDVPVGAITLDEQYIYWLGNSAVMKAKKDGSGFTQIFAASGVGFTILGAANDATNIYWLTATPTAPATGVVGQIAKDGTGFKTIASGFALSYAFASDDKSLYWALLGTAPSYADRGLMKINKDGSGLATLLTAMDLGYYCLAADGTSLYWVQSGSLFRGNPDGMSPVNLGSIRGCPVTADTGTYFMGTVAVRKVGSTGPAVDVAPISNTSALKVVAAHGNKIYFVDGTSIPGALWRINTDTQEKALVALVQYGSFVADDLALYWSTSTGGLGRIMKLVQ